MWFLEQLLWYLTEVVDETDRCVLLQWIIDAGKSENSKTVQVCRRCKTHL
jgi:hypothetical protein